MVALRVIPGILTSLDQGKLIRESVARAIQILAALVVLGALFALIEMIKVSFQLPTEGTVGGLVLSTLFALSVVAVVQILFFRAAVIRQLPDSSFTVIPVFSLLLRAIGEIYAALVTAVGIGGCIFLWLAKFDPLRLLPGYIPFLPSPAADATFVGGLLFLASFCIVGFAGLIIFYVLAESSMLLADVAINTQRLLAASTLNASQPSKVPTSTLEYPQASR